MKIRKQVEIPSPWGGRPIILSVTTETTDPIDCTAEEIPPSSKPGLVKCAAAPVVALRVVAGGAR